MGVDLVAARDKLLPDLLAHGLDVLFCGINPGLHSAAVGRHFAKSGNRFWPALHLGGFTPRLFTAADQDELLPLGLGLTNIVARASARADELTAAELRAGAVRLTGVAEEYRPKVVAVVGVTAYRTAFERKKAAIGAQTELIAGSRLWVLPNPSGLNAHYQLPALGDAFADLRASL